MASRASIVRRALLYVPGTSQKMLDKSRQLPVDCVAYDLEDSVTMSKKAEARMNVSRFLESERPAGSKDIAVRINAVGSGLVEDDLAAVCTSPNLNTVVIPKVNSAADLRWVDQYVAHHRVIKESNAHPLPPVTFLALIESAKAISNLTEICRASPLLSGLIFAAEDFALDLSLTRTPSLTEFLYARSAIATAARAHELPSTIDLVCTSYKGDDGVRRMEEECLGGKGLGFNGKQCIHPDQVAIAHKAFSPSAAEAEWAVRIVIAAEKANRAGRGAWTLDGGMIDAPVISKARALVDRAELCQTDLEQWRKKWHDQEPE